MCHLFHWDISNNIPPTESRRCDLHHTDNNRSESVTQIHRAQTVGNGSEIKGMSQNCKRDHGGAKLDQSDPILPSFVRVIPCA